MAVKMALDRHKQKDTELKARLECGLICAELAVGQYDALMQDLKEKFGADYSPLFARGRYDQPLHTWRQLCALYVKTDDPSDFIDLNDDPNLRLAADVLARKLSDSDILNRIGKHAIEMNRPQVCLRGGHAGPGHRRQRTHHGGGLTAHI